MAQQLRIAMNNEQLFSLRYRNLRQRHFFGILNPVYTLITSSILLVVFLQDSHTRSYTQSHFILVLAILNIIYVLFSILDLLFMLRRRLPNITQFRQNPQLYQRLEPFHFIIRVFKGITAILILLVAVERIISLSKYDYDYSKFTTQIIIILLGVFLYPAVCVSITALLVFGWVTFLLITALFAAIVLLFSCGKLNLFSRIIPFLRRRRQDAQILLRMNRPKQLDLQKLAKDTSKKWSDHKAIIKQSPYNQDTNQCSICLEEFKDYQDVIGLSCIDDQNKVPIHFFHQYPCAKEWFSQNSICPLCRTDYYKDYGINEQDRVVQN